MVRSEPGRIPGVRPQSAAAPAGRPGAGAEESRPEGLQPGASLGARRAARPSPRCARASGRPEAPACSPSQAAPAPTPHTPPRPRLGTLLRWARGVCCSRTSEWRGLDPRAAALGPRPSALRAGVQRVPWVPGSTGRASLGGGGLPSSGISSLSPAAFGGPLVLEIQIRWSSGPLLFIWKGAIEGSSKRGIEREGATSNTDL